MAISRNKPLAKNELSAFCEQMAVILKSGISSLEGIELMLEDAASTEEEDLMRVILEDLRESSSLTHALAKSGVFPAYAIHMTAIGEVAGRLDEVMDALSVHYAREDALAKNIRSAVTYPLIMVVVMIAVIVVLLVKVMPIFNQVFVQLSAEMTGFAAVLLKIGNAMNTYSIVWIIILAILIGLILFGIFTGAGRSFFKNLSRKLPGFRAVYTEQNICRFASAMALTLRSGLVPDRSVDLVSRLSDDQEFSDKLDHCKEQLKKGEGLARALASCDIFPGLYARILTIGAKTGNLENSMDQIADLSQDTVNRKISRALSVLEPTLVIALSLIVGVILLSVMLPLIGIMSGI